MSKVDESDHQVVKDEMMANKTLEDVLGIDV